MNNIQRLDLNLLVTLDVLLSEHNVTRAAQRLNLSQPSVSVHLAKLREVEAQIDAMGASGGGRRRPKNDMNLVEALSKALDGKTMSVTEVAEAVQRQGYRTSSPSFRTIVNQTLINSGKFKRVSRGQYTLK